MIDQDGPHGFGGHPEKMRPALPFRLLIYQPEVGLMHQRGRLQSVAGRLPPHVALGLMSELAVHGGKEGIQCCAIPATPSLEQRSDVLLRGASRGCHRSVQLRRGARREHRTDPDAPLCRRFKRPVKDCG
jgi:hypothetical protein